MAIIRRHYIFYGRVQGVGFRYRAYYAARENNVTGWVRNEYDGSVEMEAEGSPENIENMLLSVENSRYIRWREVWAVVFGPSAPPSFPSSLSIS